MNFKYCIISITNIDFQDRSYLFSYPKRDSLLKDSIKSVGLLQPPILFLKKDFPKFKIVCGEGRAIACRELGISEIPAFVTSQQDPKELLLLSLESNLFRNLNIVEKAEFMKKALGLFSLEEVINLLPKLNLTPSYHWVDFLEKISNLEDKFKDLMVQNRLNPQVSKIISNFSSEEREKFLEILEKLNLSFSEQKEVVEKLLDYKKRKDLPHFLPKESEETLKERDFNRRKKEFFKTLNELYYPSYSAKLQKISPLVQKFKSKNIVISPSQFFERKEIEVHFKITSYEDFIKKSEFIEKNKEEIKKLLEEI